MKVLNSKIMNSKYESIQNNKLYPNPCVELKSIDFKIIILMQLFQPIIYHIFIVERNICVYIYIYIYIYIYRERE